MYVYTFKEDSTWKGNVPLPKEEKIIKGSREMFSHLFLPADWLEPSCHGGFKRVLGETHLRPALYRHTVPITGVLRANVKVHVLELGAANVKVTAL